MKSEKFAIAVLLSGSGSNLQAMIDTSARPDCPFCISIVISDQPKAHGLIRAKKAGIATAVVAGKDFTDRTAYDEELKLTLAKYPHDLLVLAGFMRILTAEFTQAYAGRAINIHPALLPKYRGLHTHAKALANQDTLHGSTVHFVTEALDGGPIIAYTQLTIAADETEASLCERIKAREHLLYPEVICQLAKGNIKLIDTQIFHHEKPLAEHGYYYDTERFY